MPPETLPEQLCTVGRSGVTCVDLPARPRHATGPTVFATLFVVALLAAALIWALRRRPIAAEPSREPGRWGVRSRRRRRR